MARCHDGVVVLPTVDSVKPRPKNACGLFNWICQRRRKSSPAVSPPKLRMTEISSSRLRKCEDGQLAGAATTQDAYGREISCRHTMTRMVRSGREVSPANLHTAKNLLTFDPAD